MTAPVMTPSGIPELESPSSGTASFSYRYLQPDSEIVSYQVRFVNPAPPALRVSLELGREANGVWAHIPELDVSAEGADVAEAFRNVFGAAQAWLAYIRDESPDLSVELEGQARYVSLIDAPVFSWFKSFRFAD